MPWSISVVNGMLQGNFTAAGASGVSNNLKIKKHRINAMLSGWAVFN